MNRQHRNSNVLTLSSLILITTYLQVMLCSFSILFITCYHWSLESIAISEQAKARNPIKYKRKTWNNEQCRFSDVMFYRLFRMDRNCFNQLCNRIKSAVGEKDFKSEWYLQQLDDTDNTDRTSRIHRARNNTSGKTISGEWKLALTLRIMAGATYLDMYLWSNISPNHVCTIFNYVTKSWINKALHIDIYEDTLFNNNRLQEIIESFSSTSDGILTGYIGAIDGWLVAIRCPTLSEVNNPGKYFARKGFYALNVQVICDKNKKIIWRSIGQLGSIHDSRAFNISSFATYLKANVQKFTDACLYFVGDSAYALRPYLMTPYDNVLPGTKEDTFNYFLSRNRIYVECVFGEINRRFGIFWRPLEGKLDRHVNTIDAAFKLHNYIVDYRLANLDTFNEAHEERHLDIERHTFNLDNPGEMEGMITEEALLQNRRGRRTNEDRELREEGVKIRDNLRDSLWHAGLRRPRGDR